MPRIRWFRNARRCSRTTSRGACQPLGTEHGVVSWKLKNEPFHFTIRMVSLMCLLVVDGWCLQRVRRPANWALTLGGKILSHQPGCHMPSTAGDRSWVERNICLIAHEHRHQIPVPATGLA
ncbi:hypothetical protein CEXT_253581 [Caerostris extrusa]|uniref:Uncharacterized protein n=1 Tax=Caerostris extrusa TaxID=172846 RepID=A0AAV4WER6_CAEEX|nr:hypothetical protein CEXT_253581 [Caerostris extrusa]